VNSSRHEVDDTPATPATPATVAQAAEVLVAVVPRAMRQVRTVARSVAAGLSVPQFRTLRYINRHPGSGLTPLAEHLGVSLPAASALVGRLEAAGLVSRNPDPAERRRIAISLTDRGRERSDSVDEAIHAWWRARLADRSPAELQALVTGLELLDAALPGADEVVDPAAVEDIA
jgi:DNA-binding MarR family transcriptional regulator